MNTISLFSGCGGMDFGAESSGARVIYASECLSDACETYRTYFPDTDLKDGDIRDQKSFPKADLVIGGYPCQSFSMGGNRKPQEDKRTFLYLEFARCLHQVQPKYFIAENVAGLKKIQNGRFLERQIEAFNEAGSLGYRISAQMLDAKDYGVPQTRKRMFLVGVRKDLGQQYVFASPSHGKIGDKKKTSLKPYTSHGEAIADLPLWPEGEFYERPHDPDGHWSWYYMSRNRKGKWDGPSFTIVANWRHITVHPAAPTMTLTWSNLEDGWKQRWDFSNEYEHLEKDDSRDVLEAPRRLSWRECSRIQTFPKNFEPAGKVESKFTQIGNAVPPMLAEAVIRPIVDGSGLFETNIAQQVSAERFGNRKKSNPNQMLLFG